MLHGFAVELFRFFQLVSEIQKGQGRDRTETKGNSPSGVKLRIIFASDKDHDHSDEGRNDETKVDLKIGEHDEPAIAVALLELSSAFGAGDRSGGIFSSEALSAYVRFLHNIRVENHYPIPIPTRNR